MYFVALNQQALTDRRNNRIIKHSAMLVWYAAMDLRMGHVGERPELQDFWGPLSDLQFIFLCIIYWNIIVT